MNIATFRAAYPEFRAVSDAQLQAALDVAAGQLPQDSLTTLRAPWYGYADTAHGLLTAHAVTLSPSGQHARLVPPRGAGADWAGQTTYYARFEQLRTEVTAGERIIL